MLSIVVPVYNVKDYLIRCLDSIYGQTYQDYEVILVDDGSTDGSSELLDEYCADKPQFRVFHKENSGPMATCKFGLHHCSGDYVGFIDSDDYIDPTMYEKMMRQLAEKSADIVLCNHYYVNEQTGSKSIHRNPISAGYYTDDELARVKEKVLPRLGSDYVSPSRCTKVIKKSLLMRMEKFTDDRITSADDVNYIDSCLFNCDSLIYLDEPLYYYIYHATSISHVFKEKIFVSYEILIQNLTAAVTEAGLNDTLAEQLKDLYNFYGILWAQYVSKSSLSAREKKQQFMRLYDNPAYKNASVLLKKHPGTVTRIYQIAFQTKMPCVFFVGMKLHRWICSKINK